MRLLLAILLLSVVNNPPAHSTVWKTGAIITITSVGVSLLGAALTLHGLGDPDYGGGGNGAEFWAGIAMSIAGDGGALIAGPALWIAGIHRDPGRGLMRESIDGKWQDYVAAALLNERWRAPESRDLDGDG